MDGLCTVLSGFSTRIIAEIIHHHFYVYLLNVFTYIDEVCG